MRKGLWIGLGCLVVGFASGCGEDNPMAPVVFEPPASVRFETGANTIRASWNASSFEGSGEFGGYNVYVDTVSMAGNNDAAFLAARVSNVVPVNSKSFTVSQLGDGSSLQQGVRYFVHVRTRRMNGELSSASNEVQSAPRPEGDNGSDPSQFAYDYDVLAPTKSGYGWNKTTGAGVSYSASSVNANVVDVFMIEEPNSADEGSMFVSPSIANFTAAWATRRATLFKDLGIGDTAWNTGVAPDPGTMTTSLKVQLDHTYAIRTEDGHWVKLRIVDLVKNNAVTRSDGSEARLNYARFQHAFQLIAGYDRFKSAP